MERIHFYGAEYLSSTGRPRERGKEGRQEGKNVYMRKLKRVWIRVYVEKRNNVWMSVKEATDKKDCLKVGMGG